MTINMSPDIAKCPRKTGGGGGGQIHPVAVGPYLKQDSEEESCPHKSLNFDMVET